MVTTLASMSSGTVSSSRSQDRATAVGLSTCTAGQQRLDPRPGRGGLAGDGGDLVTGGLQSGRQDGADTAGTDYPDSGHDLITFRSSPETGTGRCADAYSTSVRAASPGGNPASGWPRSQDRRRPTLAR